MDRVMVLGPEASVPQTFSTACTPLDSHGLISVRATVPEDPNIQYGPMISKGFISTSNNWDEYSQLRMIENNWGLPTLSYDAQSPVMTDILGTGGPQALSASFTYTPLSPATGAVVGFSGIAA